MRSHVKNRYLGRKKNASRLLAREPMPKQGTIGGSSQNLVYIFGVGGRSEARISRHGALQEGTTGVWGHRLVVVVVVVGRRGRRGRGRGVVAGGRGVVAVGRASRAGGCRRGRRRSQSQSQSLLRRIALNRITSHRGSAGWA